MGYFIHYFMMAKLFFCTIQEDNNACCYQWKHVNQNFLAKEALFQLYISKIKWPNSVIYYDVDPHMDPVIRHYVSKSIDYFNKNKLTCVRWRQHFPGESENPQKHWVTFLQVRDSLADLTMSADLGYNTLQRKNTVIRLGYQYAKRLLLLEKNKLRVPDGKRGLAYRGLVIHEMMHVMGFWHEQQRGDRDCWVYVDETLKKDPSYYVFQQWRSHFSPKFPYDLNSIMHYPNSGQNFYAHDGSKLWRWDGQLSALDYYKVNYVYCNKPAYCDITTQCADDWVEHRYNPRCFREGPSYNNTPTTCTPCHRPVRTTTPPTPFIEIKSR